MLSKKELLKELNISYGQLYRWKREGLIPDSWFIKQAVSTGQETYFKRDQIIPRINKILELKDKYQLDQIKSFLNPDTNNKKFVLRELIIIDEIDPIILKSFFKDKETISIYEACMVYILSISKDILNFEEYIDYNYSNLGNLNIDLYILKLDSYYLLIADNNTIIDKRINIYKKFKLEDIASKIASNL